MNRPIHGLILLLSLCALTTSIAAAATFDSWHLIIVTETTSDDGGIQAPTIFGDRIAWLQRYRDEYPIWYHVFVHDLTTGETRDLGHVWPQCDVDDVRINGDWIVAEMLCPSESNSVHAYNLVTEEKIAIGPFSIDPFTQDFYPKIDGNHIIWIHANEMQRDIYLFDLESRKKTAVTFDTAWETYPDVSGDWVVWEDHGQDIFAKNVVTGEQIQITDDDAIQQWPRIDGDLIVWEDNRNGNWDIYSFDLVTREIAPLVTGPAKQTRGLPSGGILSYYYCPDQPQCWEEDEIRALNLMTGETSTVHLQDEDESYAPEQHNGNMVWWYQTFPDEGPSHYEVRLATYLNQHTIMPTVFNSTLP